MRRRCLDFLDHYAADESGAVFLEALSDPVAPVRGSALHGLASERCRTEELCIPEVLTKVVAVLESDPDPELRAKTIPILLRLAARERLALDAIGQAAERDTDDRVRAVAGAALRGEHPPRWNHARRTVGSRRSKASRD